MCKPNVLIAGNHHLNENLAHLLNLTLAVVGVYSGDPWFVFLVVKKKL